MKKFLFALSFLLVSQNLFAFGWPVIDFQSIIELIKVYDTDKEILTNGVSELENAKSQLTSMTSLSYYSNMFNTPEEVEARLYTAQSWQDALKGISGGNNQRYQQLLKSYETAHPEISAQDYRVSHTEKQFKQFDEHQKTVKTVAATSQTEYANTDTYMKNINAIGKEASSTNNTGVKTAIDLNTRMTEQLGYLIASNIRLQSVNNNLASSNAQESLDKQKVVDDFYSTTKG